MEECTYSNNTEVCEVESQDCCISEEYNENINDYYDWKLEKEAEIGVIIDASWGERGRFLTIYREPENNEEIKCLGGVSDPDLIISYKNNLFSSPDAVYAWCQRHWDKVLKDILNKLNN